MRRIVDRYGPTSPTGRAVASAVFGSVGFTALLLVLAHLFAVQYQFTESTSVLLTLTVGLVFTALAYWEAVVRRAKAAPEPPRESAPETGSDRESSETDADPIADLQHRYSQGELSTEEFEERVDRLVETDHRIEETDVRDLELDRT